MTIGKTVLTIVLTCIAAFGASTQIVLTDVFDGNLAAKDYGGDYSIMMEGGFSCHNDIVHYWNASTGYSVLDATTGDVSLIGKPAVIKSNGYGDPFGVYDPLNDCFYAATCDYMSDGYLYRYDYSTLEWSEIGSAVNFYGGAVYQGELYFSGLNEPWDGGYGQTTYISRFVPDSPHTYGGSNLQLHDSIIETAGNSAHLTIDAHGNIYYATYSIDGTSALYKWTRAQVETVINDIANNEEDEFLTLADGEKLTDLPGGANGLAADEDGNVFITVNMPSYLLMWNGISGDGHNYTIIAEPTFEWGWMGAMAIEGSFDSGDVLYGSYNFYGPVTTIALPAACINRPEMDFDGDCMVTISDFAIFASQWLSDGLGYKLQQ